VIFVGLFSHVFVLHVGKGIIIPIVFATILAILLNPLVNFLVKKKVNIIVGHFAGSTGYPYTDWSLGAVLHNFCTDIYVLLKPIPS
jgi:hypothetical protein